MNPQAINALVDYVRRTCAVDSPAEFRVVIDDSNIPTFAVESRSYYDADRAGWSGYMNKPIASGLDQNTAVDLAALLEGKA